MCKLIKYLYMNRCMKFLLNFENIINNGIFLKFVIIKFKLILHLLFLSHPKNPK